MHLPHFDGYIFDMNGVIIDDERFHQYSWKKLCEKWGKTLTEEQFEKNIFGRREKDTFEFLLSREVAEEELGKLSDERTAIVMEEFGEQMHLVPGVREFLKGLHQNGAQIGLATSSRRPYMHYILDRFQLRPYFGAIVTSEDCIHGKPDPEIYLKAAHLLGVDPTSCVAFEDSVSGIHSAQAAGMKVIGIATTQSLETLEALGVTVVNDFL